MTKVSNAIYGRVFCSGTGAAAEAAHFASWTSLSEMEAALALTGDDLDRYAWNTGARAFVDADQPRRTVTVALVFDQTLTTLSLDLIFDWECNWYVLPDEEYSLILED